MATITDNRHNRSIKQVSNRQKFLRRYRKQIKNKVQQQVKDAKITDFGKNRNITIKDTDLLKEPKIKRSRESLRDIVVPGNRKLRRGDKFSVPPSSQGKVGGPGDSDSETSADDFEFLLTTEEFMDIYFSDMQLPNFIKKNLKTTNERDLVTGGYSKYGPPPRLSVRKTFEKALARRLANKKAGHKSRFLDDSDLRYIRREYIIRPAKSAVMFCVMDVSGSMTRDKKDLAKRFFIFLYLFLKQNYKNIDVVFIRHHHHANECDEHEFFYSLETGGTVVSTAFELVDDIIDKRYNCADYNIYIAQASDGDNWPNDNERLHELLTNTLLNKVQYFTYVAVKPEGWPGGMWDMYDQLSETYKNFALGELFTPADIYPVLRELFKTK